jgi:hypothetical protein
MFKLGTKRARAASALLLRAMALARRAPANVRSTAPRAKVLLLRVRMPALQSHAVAALMQGSQHGMACGQYFGTLCDVPCHAYISGWTDWEHEMSNCDPVIAMDICRVLYHFVPCVPPTTCKLTLNIPTRRASTGTPWVHTDLWQQNKNVHARVHSPFVT